MMSSVNVTKSAVSCGFGHIYWRSPLWKTSFFVQCKSYNVIINGKNFYDQPIIADIKLYEEIRKLTGNGKDYTAGCLLDYEYVKNNYRLVSVYLSRQKN